MADHLNKRITKLEEKVGHLERLNAPRQNTHPVGTHKESKQNSESTPRESAVTDDDGTDNGTNEPERQHDNRRPWWFRMWAWKPWKRGLSILVGVAGIGYAIITYYEWRDLRHNFAIDQRPYVWIDRVVAKEVIIGKPIRADVYFTNYGKAPARKVATFVHVAFGRPLRQLCEQRGTHESNTQGYSVIGAGKSDVWKTAISVADPTAEQSTIVNWNGERPVVVYGSMLYIDGLDSPYLSTFCVELLEGSNIPMFVEGENNLQ